MRFLLHNEDAVYDAAKKVWHYTLDRRISHPTSLTVKKVTFTPVSTLTVHPHVIYMHSTALSQMIIDKHTVVLRGEAHENSTDVIGVLEETHSRGRYALTEREGPFRMSPSAHQRVIDIYFTDGTGAHMDGEPAAGGSASGGAADDQTMIDLGANILKMWIDMSYSPLDTNSVQVTEDNANVAFLQNRQPGTGVLFFTCSANDFVLTPVGETKGIVGGASASWASATDGSVVGITSPCSLHYIFRVPPTTASQGILSLPGEMFKHTISGNSLTYKAYGQYAHIQSVTFLTNQFYYVECNNKGDPDGDGIPNFSWRFIKLSDPGTIITEDTDGSILSTTWTNGWSISAANDHFTCTLGPMVLLEGGNQEKRDVVKDWMLAKYSSASVEGAEAPPPPAPATFLVELDIKQSQR